MHPRNESSHRAGIHAGTAWQLMGHLRGRDQCSLAVRFAQAPRDQSGRVRPAEERTAESRQQERSGGCTQTKRPASRGTSHAGISRRVRSPRPAGTESQLSRGQQRSHARDESSQGDLSELGDSLRRPASLFPAPSRRLAGKTAGSRRASPGGADLSTTRLFDGDTEGNAEGVVGGKPETSRPSVPPTGSPAGPDPGGPSDRSHSDTASFPHQAPTLELLRTGPAD